MPCYWPYFNRLKNHGNRVIITYDNFMSIINMFKKNSGLFWTRLLSCKNFIRNQHAVEDEYTLFHFMHRNFLYQLNYSLI